MVPPKPNAKSLLGRKTLRTADTAYYSPLKENPDNSLKEKEKEQVSKDRKSVV